jgi:hypothetical protein
MFQPRKNKTAWRRTARHTRRGVTIVVVLGLIAMTIALSYAMIRTQAMSMRIQRNLDRRGSARQAAITGLTIAIRKMHDADWEGIDSVVAGVLNDTDGFSAIYATGDADLEEDDEDYDEYPFRVTIASTGYSTDPADPTERAIHKAEAVVRLVRRKFSPTPANWDDLQRLDDDIPYTIHQWGNATVSIELPSQINGAARFQGPVKLCDDYPTAENRPFDGTLDEVAVFDAAISETDLRNMYDAGRGMHASSLASLYRDHSRVAWWRFDEAAGGETASDVVGGNNGTLEGPKTGAEGLAASGGGLGVEFDGYNDYIDAGAFNVSGDQLTLVGWFKADTFANETDMRIISKATGYDTGEHHWMLGTCKHGDSIRLRFRLRTGGSTTTLESSAGSISAGSWVFAAAVYDGVEMKLYQNGALVGSTTKSGTISQSSSARVWIGNNPPGSARARLLRDLEKMRAAGYDDQRPFTGNLHLGENRTAGDDLSLLSEDLGLTITSVPATSSSPLTVDGDATTYRLYPGGKEYEVEELGWYLENEVHEPDMVDNPLGLFSASHSVVIAGNVKITGTVFTNSLYSDIYFSGDGVRLTGADLAPLEGSTDRVQLPVVVATDDIRVQTVENVSVDGMAIAGDDFDVHPAYDSTDFDLNGLVLCREFEIRSRGVWDQSDWWWLTWLKGFYAQAGGPEAIDSIPYFPAWIEEETVLETEPQITFNPSAEPVSYHWQDWDEPIYQPGDDDEGLLWDLIRWKDNP